MWPSTAGRSNEDSKNEGGSGAVSHDGGGREGLGAENTETDTLRDTFKRDRRFMAPLRSWRKD